MALDDLKLKAAERWEGMAGVVRGGTIGKVAATLIGIYLLGVCIVGFFWDTEPAAFDVTKLHLTNVAPVNESVTGATTVATLIELTDTLLNKRGGYLSNDIMPPGVWMDNVPNWEFGVLVQIRDMARTLRNNLSRSQSQSAEDPDLVNAENQFYIDNDKWIWPETEREYRKGRNSLASYLARLQNPREKTAQFYARADNLSIWLSEVETRLGSLSQRLSTSVGKRQLDISLAGDAAARQSTAAPAENVLKTPWTQLDDVFYEARGTTWALIHLLKAVEIDFRDVLLKKNALVSLQQIIRELEGTQQTLWSPVILNGDGFGVLANHSLVMASYISRANAALIDLRNLLAQG